TAIDNNSRDYSPRFSPDGQSLLFVRSSSNAASDIYVRDMLTGNIRRLTQEQADVRGATWMGTSGRILFSSNRNGAYSLWILDPSKNEITPVQAPAQSAIEPSADANGNHVVFRSSTETVNLHVLPIVHNPAGTSAAVASSSRASNSGQYSPDG